MDRERRRIGVSGAGGLVGRAVVDALRARGDEVRPLVRRPAGAGEIHWDPAQGRLAPEDLAPLHTVIHLAGEPIAAGRWTPDRKRRIRESRVHGTRLVAEAMASLQRGPRHLICASATGYYGERGDEPCVENDPPGEDFLSGVCAEWEGAAAVARTAGIRTVHCRIGVVLSTEGGALPRMLPVFRWGLGGPLGSGRQYWNWIELGDLVRIFLRAADEEDLEGPVNAVAPEALPCARFVGELGRVLHRPAVLPVPAFALRAVLGEMADALLCSTRAVPQRLLERGHAFTHATLAGALDALLG